jgi:hypothetical protein
MRGRHGDDNAAAAGQKSGYAKPGFFCKHEYDHVRSKRQVELAGHERHICHDNGLSRIRHTHAADHRAFRHCDGFPHTNNNLYGDGFQRWHQL